MICEKCKKIIVLHAFTDTECEHCGDKIQTHHIPGYKICEKCSDKYIACQQCGLNIKT